MSLWSHIKKKRESSSAHFAWGAIASSLASTSRRFRGPVAGAGVGLTLGIGLEFGGQVFGWKPEPLDVPTYVAGGLVGALLGSIIRKSR